MDATGAFQNSIDELENISSTRYENIFRLFTKQGKYIYNILRSINIDLNNASPDTYTISSTQFETSWTNISYQAYGTPELWWLIYITNKNVINNPVQLVPGGVPLRFIKPDKLKDVLDQITIQLNPKK